VVWSARQLDEETQRKLFASRLPCLLASRSHGGIATILASKLSIARLEAVALIDGAALLRAFGLANNGSLIPFG
jgi:hypothetical protein